MNVRRVALQGLIAGAGALSIATQGFQPLSETPTAGGGGGSSFRLSPAVDLLASKKRLIRDDEEVILLIASLIASGQMG